MTFIYIDICNLFVAVTASKLEKNLHCYFITKKYGINVVKHIRTFDYYKPSKTNIFSKSSFFLYFKVNKSFFFQQSLCQNFMQRRDFYWNDTFSIGRKFLCYTQIFLLSKVIQLTSKPNIFHPDIIVGFQKRKTSFIRIRYIYLFYCVAQLIIQIPLSPYRL